MPSGLFYIYFETHDIHSHRYHEHNLYWLHASLAQSHVVNERTETHQGKTLQQPENKHTMRV